MDFKLKDIKEPTPFKLVFDSPRKSSGIRGEDRYAFKLIRLSDGVEGDLWTSNQSLAEQISAFGRGDSIMISRVGTRPATYLAEALPASEPKDVLPEEGEVAEIKGKLATKHYAEVMKRAWNEAFKAMALFDSEGNRQALADQFYGGNLDLLPMPEPMDLFSVDNLARVAASFWISSVGR